MPGSRPTANPYLNRQLQITLLPIGFLQKTASISTRDISGLPIVNWEKKRNRGATAAPSEEQKMKSAMDHALKTRKAATDSKENTTCRIRLPFKLVIVVCACEPLLGRYEVVSSRCQSVRETSRDAGPIHKN